MAWAPLLLLLLLFRGSFSQPVVTQPPSASVSPGQTAQIACSVTNGNGLDYYAKWYQQKPGSAPRLLVYADNDGAVHTFEGVPARFSGSMSGSTASTFTITGVKEEDDAIYHCGTYDNTYNYIFGGGTQLNVNTGETKAPTLSIFPPSTEEIDTNKATLVCQCQDFYPAALAWTWTVNDQTINTGVDSTRPTKQTDNNLFMAGSFLSINAIDWKANNIYTCKATHEGKIFQASVKQSECI